MSWNNLFFSTDGRIDKKSWWIGMVGLFIAVIVLTVLTREFFPDDPLTPILPGLLVFYPSICLHAKRFHDRGKSGWWYMIMSIPLFGVIWLVFDLGMGPGDPNTNQYGPAPMQL